MEISVSILDEWKEHYSQFLLCTLRSDQASKRYSESMQHWLDATREVPVDAEKVTRLLEDREAAKVSHNGCSSRYSVASQVLYDFADLHRLDGVIPPDYIPTGETAHLYLEAVRQKKDDAERMTTLRELVESGLEDTDLLVMGYSVDEITSVRGGA